MMFSDFTLIKKLSKNRSKLAQKCDITEIMQKGCFQILITLNENWNHEKIMFSDIQNMNLKSEFVEIKCFHFTSIGDP